MRQETVKFAAPAAPAIDATIVLWSSVDAFGARRMRGFNFSMLQIFFGRLSHASAASGLKAYYSPDGGTNWYGMDFKDATGAATMPKTIAVLAADANTAEEFDFSNVDDAKVEYTNGGTQPTTWDPVITGIFGGIAVQK